MAKLENISMNTEYQIIYNIQAIRLIKAQVLTTSPAKFVNLSRGQNQLIVRLSTIH